MQNHILLKKVNKKGQNMHMEMTFFANKYICIFIKRGT